MDTMHELINERQVESALLALAAAGPVVGLVLGALWRRLGALRGLGLGLLGPLVWLLWRLFCHLTRFAPAAEPRNDYFGLERVDVLALNLVLFTAVGAVVGLLIRRVRQHDAAAAAAVAAARQTPETQTDH